MGTALWTLGERGVLRVGELAHRLVTDAPGAPPPALYRVNDEVEVSLDVALLEGGKATPYECVGRARTHMAQLLSATHTHAHMQTHTAAPQAGV